MANKADQSDGLLSGLGGLTGGDTKDDKGLAEEAGEEIGDIAGQKEIGGQIGGMVDGVLKETGIEKDNGQLDISEVTNTVKKMI